MGFWMVGYRVNIFFPLKIALYSFLFITKNKKASWLIISILFFEKFNSKLKFKSHKISFNLK